MRVLILSANAGTGYNSAAQAISEQMEKLGMEFEIADVLGLLAEHDNALGGRRSRADQKRLAKLLKMAGRYEENTPPRFLYEQCARGADALWSRLEANAYDAIVCVHVCSAMTVTELCRRHACTLPTYYVSTDYAALAGTSELKLDGYFLPHSRLLSEFVRCLIPADRMLPVGIPVRSAFCETLAQKEARQALGLPEEGKMVLMGCGSMGGDDMAQNALRIHDALPTDTSLVVLCGHNERAYEQLSSHPSDRLFAIGFTDRIAEYMSASDLYVTKPGGLTTAEAIAKGLPMLLVKMSKGCEGENYRFLTGCGAASGAKSWKAAAREIGSILEDDKKRAEQLEAMKRFSVSRAAETIARQILRQLGET